jgi:hypothetical protein
MATTSRVPNKLTAPASARCSKVGGIKTCEGAGLFLWRPPGCTTLMRIADMRIADMMQAGVGTLAKTL